MGYLEMQFILMNKYQKQQRSNTNIKIKKIDIKFYCMMQQWVKAILDLKKENLKNSIVPL